LFPREGAIINSSKGGKRTFSKGETVVKSHFTNSETKRKKLSTETLKVKHQILKYRGSLNPLPPPFRRLWSRGAQHDNLINSFFDIPKV